MHKYLGCAESPGSHCGRRETATWNLKRQGRALWYQAGVKDISTKSHRHAHTRTGNTYMLSPLGGQEAVTPQRQ